MDLGPLDGVVVAPANHHVLFENDHVRVLLTTIAVGETTPLHTHLAPTATYIESGSHLVRRDEHGAVMLDTRATPGFVLPRVLWSDGLGMHSLENTGDDPIVAIGVELKEHAGG